MPPQHKTDPCVSSQPRLSPAAHGLIAGITAKNLAKTPIAASLPLVAEDLAGAYSVEVLTAPRQQSTVTISGGEAVTMTVASEND